MADLNERILTSLEDSTRAITKVSGEIQEMCHRYDDLQDRVGSLETDVGTLNAHLDNLVRESQITNQLLKEDMEDRKRVQEAQAKLDAEEREHQRQLELRKLDRDEKVEDDTRALWRKIGDEVWTIFKQPLGYLVAGVVAWLLLQYFGIPEGLLPDLTGTP